MRWKKNGPIVLLVLSLALSGAAPVSGQDRTPPTGIPQAGFYWEKTSATLYCNGKAIGRSEADREKYRPHPYPKFLTYLPGRGRAMLLYEGADAWRPVLDGLATASIVLDEDFKVLNPFIARDGTTTYFIGRDHTGPLPNAEFHIFSFRPLAGNPPAASIIVLPDSRYLKSESQVYYDGRPIAGADPSSFITRAQAFPSLTGKVFNEMIGGYEYFETTAGVGTDRARVYIGGDAAPGVKPGPDFRLLSRFWIVSGGSAYAVEVSRLKKMDRVDAGSLRMIGRTFSRDKAAVFHLINALPGADPDTFRAVDDFYGRDARRVYWATSPLPGADPASIRGLARGYARDKRFVYLTGSRIEGADPAGFTLYRISSEYKKVLLESYQFEESDFYFAHDGKRVFYGAKLIPGADPASFRPEEYLINLIKEDEARTDHRH